MDSKIIQRYFEGDLNREETASLLDWVEASDANVERFRQERLLFDTTLFGLPSRPAARRNRPRIATRVMRAAVVALLLVATGGLLVDRLHKPEILSYTAYAPAGQRTMLTLSDGTIVWLNSNTTLTHTSDYGKKERAVSIDGEGYFEVIPDKTRPFLVKTPKNSLRVTGTTFNVYAYGESEWFEASLVEGAVEVLPADARHKPVVLKPGETFSILYGQRQLRPFRSDDFLLWRQGIYSFDDMPFSEILKRLERYYNIRIDVKNPRVLNYRCTGKFKQQDGIRHILTVIRKDHRFDFGISEEGDTVTIF